jgi:hypothetical protein
VVLHCSSHQPSHHDPSVPPSQPLSRFICMSSSGRLNQS